MTAAHTAVGDGPLRITVPVPNVHSYRHLGFAVDLVQADTLARYHRSLGRTVRVVSGTDENSTVTVRAARSAGVSPRELADRDAAGLSDLLTALRTPLDARVRTSASARHKELVERLWRDCLSAGDLYQGQYEGAWCEACGRFVAESGGRCPRHGTPVSPATEPNWFFRTSRHRERLRDAVASGRLRIVPAARRNEVLAFLDSGVEDMSVSRPRERSDGWGLAVPDDPGQILYTWWDVLAAYLDDGEDAHHPWEKDTEHWQIIGKGILRVHALHWPAVLLSAGRPLPSVLAVHQHLTTRGLPPQDGAKAGFDPVELAGRHGADALRWWVLREMSAGDDTDFTVGRMVRRANEDLANSVGNLVNRVVGMVHRYRAGRAPDGPRPPGTDLAVTSARAVAAEALAAFDFRAATAAVLALSLHGNRLVERTRPWELAKAEARGEDPAAARRLDAVLAEAMAVCRALAELLAPFVPDLAERIARQCQGTPLPPQSPVYPRHAEEPAPP
jgi:methionyl-tRNA synthetase